jgi:PAS domain S-box-containing protein
MNDGAGSDLDLDREREQGEARLRILRQTGLLDSPSEPAFDRVTRLASRLLRAPVSLISLASADRLFFKSQFGLPEPWATSREVPLRPSLCQIVLETARAHVVIDAKSDPALADLPAVRDMGVTAYLGVPLVTRDGCTLGAICAIDVVPRNWCADDLSTLDDLAALVVTEVELRGECARQARTAWELRLLTSAVESATDVVLITEAEPIATDTDAADRRIVYVNQAFSRATGYAPEEVLGQTPRLLQGPNTDPATLQMIRAHLAARLPVHAELIHYRKDGSEYWAELSIRPIPDENGSFSHFVSVQRDVTERKENEARLRESQRKLRAMLDGGIQFVGLLAPDGTLLEANRSALEFAGVEHDEVVGLPFSETPWFSRTVGGQERVAAAIEKARNGEVVRYEAEHTNIEGRTITIDFSLSPVRDETGEVVLLVPEGRDITERKRAEQDTRDREELLHLATQVAGLGIWDLDPATGEITWTGELLRMAGIPPIAPDDDDGDATFEVMIHPDDREAVRRDWERALAERSAFVSEYRCLRLDGSVRWIAARGRFLFDESTGHANRMVGVCLDVTERKQAEERTQERADQLRQADRRKNEFIAMLAHELRNPLAPIAHAVKVLELRDTEPALRARMRDLIGRQVRTLSQLIDDLLDVSRMTRGKIQLRRVEVELRAMVKRAVATAQPLIRQREHLLAVELPDRPVRLFADPLRLEQILVNLITNAAKYTNRGGSIRVDCRVSESGKDVLLRITDNGVGIAPELLPNVFEAFTQADQTLDRAEGGLGIGLTLVRSLVRMHGGSVEAQSGGKGQGSSFLVRLPILDESTRPARPPSDPFISTVTAAASAPRGEPLRVLVVDDNVQAAESLAIIVKHWGHVLTVCHDGQSALTRASETRPDVILLDIGLPGLDGYSVARTLRSNPEHSATVIIAVTGYGRDLNRERAEGIGFDHHFVKPVDLHALERLLATIRTGTNRVSRAVTAKV